MRAVLVPALVLTLLASAPRLAVAEDGDAKVLLARGEDAEKTNPEEAIAAYRQLLERFPGDPLAARAHLRLGLCLAKAGKPEDARAHLREARKLSKEDDIQREAEKALIGLPPPPEPKKAETAPAPKPAEGAKPHETGPRAAGGAGGAQPPHAAEVQADIERLTAEIKEIQNRVNELNEQGKTNEEYQLRQKLEKKVAAREAKRKELQGLRGGDKRPILPGKQEKREEKKAEKGDAQKGEKKRARREELEAEAHAAYKRAIEAFTQNRHAEGNAALHELARLRRELEKLGKRAELQERLKSAKERASSAELANDPAALKKAQDELAEAQKALREHDAELQEVEERELLERLAADMKARHAPEYEVKERLDLARAELQLEREHRKNVVALQREIDEKKLEPAARRERMEKLEREYHARVERLREETDKRIHEAGHRWLEGELARRAEELKKQGKSTAEVEQETAALRRDLEQKIPGKHDGDKKLAETDDPAKRMRALEEENKRLRKKVEELEKENAALREGKKKEAANAPD